MASVADFWPEIDERKRLLRCYSKFILYFGKIDRDDDVDEKTKRFGKNMLVFHVVKLRVVMNEIRLQIG